jgi:3-oxoadipate enol-lactonase
LGLIITIYEKTMANVNTRIGRLFFEEVGAGPAVVLWHSFLCDHTMWNAQVDGLKDKYRLIVMDGPGHGLSAQPPETFVLADCVPATLDVLDAAGVQRAAIAGISWGGLVAMDLAIRAPARVSGLALFSTSADAEGLLSRAQNGILARIAKRYGIVKPLEPVMLSSLFSPGFPRRRPDVCRTLLRDIRAADRTALFRVMTAITRRSSFIDALPSIRVPTLVVSSTADRITRPICGDRIAERIPGAQSARLPGCGHMSPLEEPEKVTRLLEDFLPVATGCQTNVIAR